MSLIPKCVCGTILPSIRTTTLRTTLRSTNKKSLLTESNNSLRNTRSASTSTLPSSSATRSKPIPTLQEEYARRRAALHAERNRSLLLYSSATIILVTAASYLAVPLYRVFCSATGYAGTPLTDKSRFSSDKLLASQDLDTRRIKVKFNADRSDSLPWSFEPLQKEVKVLPGETALAFYTATNKSDEDIIGIATYNVTPNNVCITFLLLSASPVFLIILMLSVSSRLLPTSLK